MVLLRFIQSKGRAVSCRSEVKGLSQATELVDKRGSFPWTVCVLGAGGEGAMAWNQIQSNLQTVQMQGRFGLQHECACQLKMYNAKSTHISTARATSMEAATPQLTNPGIRQDGKVSQQKEEAI